MARSRVERLADEFREALAAADQAAVDRAVAAYQEAARAAEREARRFARMLQAEADRLGVSAAEVARLNPSWPFQQDRYQRIAAEIRARVSELTSGLPAEIRAAKERALMLAEEHARAMMNAQLGSTPRALRQLEGLWAGGTMEGAEAMIANLADGTPVASVLGRYSAMGAEAAAEALLEGFLLGSGTDEIARQIRDVLGTSLGNATRIARTETIRAYRLSATEQFSRNSHLIGSWTWWAELGRRTCVACYAQHGTKHPVTETLSDHPNGRCAMLPESKPWDQIAQEQGMPQLAELEDLSLRDLGGGDAIFSGEEFLRGLDPVERARILGPRARWFEAGVPLDELSTVRRSDIWGDAIGPKPLRDLQFTHIDQVRAAQAAQRKATAAVKAKPKVRDPSDALYKRPRMPPEAQTTMDEIDQLHGLPRTPTSRVPVMRNDRLEARGNFERSGSLPAQINLRINGAEWPELTMAHEYGHLLDYEYLGTLRVFSSEVGDETFNDFWRAVVDTPTSKRLIRAAGDPSHAKSLGLSNQEYVEYLNQPREIWARAYAQWVATRSGHPVLAGQLDTAIARSQAGFGRHPSHWTRREFEPIARAIDRIMGVGG